MSQVGEAQIAQLHAIAEEVREVISERGYKTDVVLDMDAAYRASGRVRSELLRALIADGVSRGASLARVHFERSRGAVQLTLPTSSHLCLFRLRRAEKRGDGTYVIPTNSAAAWGTLDEATLDIVEHWVLGFTVDEAGALGDLFAAEVLGVDGGVPGQLRLGSAIHLGSAASPSYGFKPSDEGLPGFEDDEDFGFGSAAG